MNGGFEINRHFFLNICILPIFCSLKEMTGSTSYLLILFLCFQSSLYRRTWRIPQRCSYSENEDPQKAQVFVGRPHRAALIISKPINTGKSLTRPPVGPGILPIGAYPKPLFSSGKFTIYLFQKVSPHSIIEPTTKTGFTKE